MGDHETGFLFTDSVIGLYDKDKLDKETLEALIDALKNATDPDFGDACEVKAKDGLNIMEIVYKIIAPKSFEVNKENEDIIFDFFMERIERR